MDISADIPFVLCMHKLERNEGVSYREPLPVSGFLWTVYEVETSICTGVAMSDTNHLCGSKAD